MKNILAQVELIIATQFPEIDHLLQTEDFDRINKSFAEAYDTMEKLSKSRGGLGKSRDARKVMRAIERVTDLLKDLLKLKYQMDRGGEQTPQEKR